MRAVKLDNELLIRSFDVELVDGDDQQAVEQSRLRKPLVVRVIAGYASPFPVEGVPVRFAVVKGKGELEVTPTAQTGADGKARTEVRYASESSPVEDDAEVQATVLLDQMKGHYPEQLELLIRTEQKSLTALFHVQEPVYHLVTKMKDLANEAKAWSDKIQTAREDKDVRAVMKALSRLHDVEMERDPVIERLRVLHPPSVQGVDGLGKPALDELTDLVESFELWLVKGDKQQAVIGRSLEDPLEVQLIAELEEKKVPVSGVLVRFALDQSKAQIEFTPTAKTGADGKARTEVRYASESSPVEDDAEVQATVLLDQMKGHYPEQLESLIRKQQELLTARFHVQEPVYHLVTKMKDLANEAKAWSDRIQSARAKGDVRGVMEGLSRLHEVQMHRDPVVERLRVLHPPSVQGVAGLGKYALGNLKRLVSSIEFRLVKGDKQQAVIGRSLEDPLKVQLIADLDGKEVPVSGVPVRFAFAQGRGEIDPKLDSTDQKGYAHTVVHRIEPAENAHDIKKTVIIARLNVADLESVLPASVRKLFREHVDAQARRFRIDTPLPCSSPHPFDSPLFWLACSLAEKVDQSFKKPAIVHNFVERESGETHQLSARIEESLANGLKWTKVLKILPSGEPSGASDAEVEVSGTIDCFKATS